MKKNKSGFTLTEVLMVIVIVGFILAMTVHTFNSLRASYTSLSYFTYKNVGLMVRTLFLEKYAKENKRKYNFMREDGRKYSISIKT